MDSNVAVTVYVGNLPWRLTEDGLAEAFKHAGQVEAVRIITDRDTGRSRGFGFVELSGIELDDVIKAMEGVEIGGRQLTLGPGRPRPERI